MRDSVVPAYIRESISRSPQKSKRWCSNCLRKARVWICGRFLRGVWQLPGPSTYPHPLLRRRLCPLTVGLLGTSAPRTGSRGIPALTVRHHRVQDHQQLVHARHQGYLLQLAARDQSVIEILDHRVVATSRKRSQVEPRPHVRSSTPDPPLATKQPAIPVSYTHLRAHETRHDLVC